MSDKPKAAIGKAPARWKGWLLAGGLVILVFEMLVGFLVGTGGLGPAVQLEVASLGDPEFRAGASAVFAEVGTWAFWSSTEAGQNRFMIWWLLFLGLMILLAQPRGAPTGKLAWSIFVALPLVAGLGYAPRELAEGEWLCLLDPSCGPWDQGVLFALAWRETIPALAASVLLMICKAVSRWLGFEPEGESARGEP